MWVECTDDVSSRLVRPHPSAGVSPRPSEPERFSGRTAWVPRLEPHRLVPTRPSRVSFPGPTSPYESPSRPPDEGGGVRVCVGCLPWPTCAVEGTGRGRTSESLPPSSWTRPDRKGVMLPGDSTAYTSVSEKVRTPGLSQSVPGRPGPQLEWWGCGPVLGTGWVCPTRTSSLSGPFYVEGSDCPGEGGHRPVGVAPSSPSPWDWVLYRSPGRRNGASGGCTVGKGSTCRGRPSSQPLSVSVSVVLLPLSAVVTRHRGKYK